MYWLVITHCVLQVYIVTGGYDGVQRLASTEIFQGGEWREGNPLPSPRLGARAGILGGRMFLTGGRAGATVLDEVVSFHPDTETWVTEEKLDTRMGYHAVTAIPLQDIHTYCTGEE